MHYNYKLFHNFYALLSSTVFHNCSVVLLSAILILSTTNFFSLNSRLGVVEQKHQEKDGENFVHYEFSISDWENSIFD